jgi:hypothetical protein
VYLVFFMLRIIIHIILVAQVMLIPFAGISALTPEASDCCSTSYQQQAEQDDHTVCAVDDSDEQESSSHKDHPADECIHFCHCSVSAIPAVIRSEFSPLFSLVPLHCDWTAPTALLHPLPIDHPPC